MTPRLVELPLVRARNHLAQARYPQAIGAFRAAMSIDPDAVGARIGLAEALSAMGRGQEAIEGLLEAAERFGERDEHEGALHLLDKALLIDPRRLELHLDLAMMEEAMGQHDAAVARVEQLAERYMDDGRTEEAAELLRFASTWGEDEASEAAEAVEAEAIEPVRAEPLRDVMSPTPYNTALITGQTVIARNPLLVALEQLERTPTAAEVLRELDRIPAPPAEAEADPELETVVVAVEAEPELETVVVAAEIDFEGEAKTTVARAPAGRLQIAAGMDEEAMVTRIAAAAYREPVPREPRRPAPPQPPAKLRPVAAPSPVVDRLRARAGLGQAGSPRRAVIRATEPISIRSTLPTTRPRQDEDVTIRYRRPQRLDAAS